MYGIMESIFKEKCRYYSETGKYPTYLYIGIKQLHQLQREMCLIEKEVKSLAEVAGLKLIVVHLKDHLNCG